MSHIATASLPVAIGLLVLAAMARAALWADVKDARLSRIAREHLGPLTTWCLILVAVHAVALGGAGELGAGSVGAALAIGAAAVLLRADGAGADEPGDAREPAERAPAPAAASPAPRSLWVEPDDERRTGLWT